MWCPKIWKQTKNGTKKGAYNYQKSIKNWFGSWFRIWKPKIQHFGSIFSILSRFGPNRDSNGGRGPDGHRLDRGGRRRGGRGGRGRGGRRRARAGAELQQRVEHNGRGGQALKMQVQRVQESMKKGSDVKVILWDPVSGDCF